MTAGEKKHLNKLVMKNFKNIESTEIVEKPKAGPHEPRFILKIYLKNGNKEEYNAKRLYRQLLKDLENGTLPSQM